MKKFSWLLLFMILCLRVAVCEEPELFRDGAASGWDSGQSEFRNELSLSARKAIELARTRFSKIKSINDSYQLTAEGVWLLAEKGDLRGAISLLREAAERFDGNRLAYLLLGAALERAGEPREAARAYAGFYKNSLTLAPEENKLISPSGLRVFRDYVEARFAAWKVPLPEEKVGLTLRRARSLTMLKGSPEGERIDLILPLIVVAGIPFLILLRLTGTVFPPAVSFFFMSFYLLCILAYVLWVAHLFGGLPFFVSPGTEYRIFFTAGASLICALYAARCLLVSKKKRKIEGAKHCPFCGGTMLDLELECPKCKRRSGG